MPRSLTVSTPERECSDRGADAPHEEERLNNTVCDRDESGCAVAGLSSVALSVRPGSSIAHSSSRPIRNGGGLQLIGRPRQGEARRYGLQVTQGSELIPLDNSCSCQTIERGNAQRSPSAFWLAGLVVCGDTLDLAGSTGRLLDVPMTDRHLIHVATGRSRRGHDADHTPAAMRMQYPGGGFHGAT